MNCAFDAGLIHEINEKYRFGPLLKELLERLPDKREVLADMGIDRNELKKAIRKKLVVVFK